MKERNNEVIIGGLLGFLAVGAILVKLISVSFTLDSSTQAVIDFSGIGVSLLLFYTVIKDKVPSPFFKNNMKSKMDSWQRSSFGLITDFQEVNNNEKIEEDKGLVDESKSFIRYFMACDFEAYMKSGDIYRGAKGEFIKLPLFVAKNYSNGLTLRFYLNRSTFKSRLKAREILENQVAGDEYIHNMANNIRVRLTNRYSNYIESSSLIPVSNTQKYEISFKLKGNFCQSAKIDILIEIINYAMLLYSYAV